MNKIYEVILKENINDIKQIKELKNKTQNVYLLVDEDISKQNQEYNFIKLHKDKIEPDEIITFAMDAEKVEKQRKKYLHRIRKIKTIKTKCTPSILQVILFNYNGNEEKNIINLIQAIKIQLLDSTENKYDYIYDSVCNYLDDRFICDNICEFKNNRCIAKRDYDLTCGCCRHYKSFLSTKLVQCEYLKDKKCAAHCITCKLFTCDYIIKNKKIKFRINDIFLLKHYFNPIQKLIILTGFFTTKEKIMKRLLKWR